MMYTYSVNSQGYRFDNVSQIYMLYESKYFLSTAIANAS